MELAADPNDSPSYTVASSRMRRAAGMNRIISGARRDPLPEDAPVSRVERLPVRVERRAMACLGARLGVWQLMTSDSLARRGLPLRAHAWNESLPPLHSQFL